MRRIITLAILIYTLVVSGVFAQEAQLPAAGPSVTQTPDLKNVTAIEIKGNKNISTNIIISKMKTRIGAPYQEVVISDDLKKGPASCQPFLPRYSLRSKIKTCSCLNDSVLARGVSADADTRLPIFSKPKRPV